MSDALVEEAAKRAGVAWLGFGDGPAYAVWVLPLEGRLYTVTGPGEQTVPGLAAAVVAGTDAVVRLRGDHGGQIIAYRALLAQVQPGSAEWGSVATQLAAKRLNSPGPAEELAARWAAECLLVSLTPLPGETVAASDASGAAGPRPTPAANETPKPFRLHRVRKPRS